MKKIEELTKEDFLQFRKEISFTNYIANDYSNSVVDEEEAKHFFYVYLEDLQDYYDLVEEDSRVVIHNVKELLEHYDTPRKMYNFLKGYYTSR